MRASYNTITSNYDPQPVTSTPRDRSGRNTPIKRKDNNYLSTSSADSSSTFINRVYDTDDDRSEAASNPFFRKQLLPSNPPQAGRYTSPNSYDQSAMKQISQQYDPLSGQNAVETHSYRESEPLSYRNNANTNRYEQPSTTRLESYRSQPDEGGFGGYNGLEYRRGASGQDPYPLASETNRYDKNEYQANYQAEYTGDRGSSKYNIEPYPSKQEVGYNSRTENKSRFHINDKYSGEEPYSANSKKYEPISKYEQPYESTRKYEEPYEQSRQYGEPSKQSIPPSKYSIPPSKYDLPPSTHEQYGNYER